ncbi:Bug family tripartite tricarboxylate transporter substrate binding protein [Comamonas testosteroni]|uniref:Bug family tripartite tricarboxylate transporter substrate binding protein n=1 Tax=Comamonas testosteroni TaxID=285 RepID=UPI0006922D70|nr:tripartite tricarboxylate transporter substrate binding protein [Comamonas testosteroni]
MIRRRTLIATALAAQAIPHMAWTQSSFISRPLKIIVPLQAGGSADISTRLIANSLQHRLKQPVIVDNKPGGSFVIGMQALTMAPPDGHTLISINTGMMAAQVTMKRYDMLKSLALVTQYSNTPTLFVVPSQSRFRTLSELIEFASKYPGKLNFGSVGTGGLEHLWVTMLGRSMGVELTHIPFKGMPDAITALAQGALDFVPCVMSSALPFVQKGSLRALCVLSNERTSFLPDLPSMKEQGVSVPPMEFWSGVAAPHGTPLSVIEQLRQEILKVMSEPEIKLRMNERGATIITSANTGAFSMMMKAEQSWMSKVAQETSIRTE